MIHFMMVILKKYEISGTKITTNITRDVCVKLTTNIFAFLFSSAITNIWLSAPGITLKIAVSKFTCSNFLKKNAIIKANKISRIVTKR